MKKMYLSKDGIVKEPYTTVRFLYNPSVKRKRPSLLLRQHSLCFPRRFQHNTEPSRGLSIANNPGTITCKHIYKI